MKVFAIIATYYGSQWIEKCLSSIASSTLAMNTIVIDNNSSDNTVALIKEKFPRVKLITSSKNLGFGAANNIGLKMALQAHADYVFLLNQDAYVNANTIEQLISVSQRNPEYGILSPYHLDYKGTAEERYFEEWVLKHYTDGFTADKESGKLKEVYVTSFVHAACWLMPIRTVQEVGGFDPLFFHYGEDNDYIQRMHDKFKKAGIVSQAILFHNGSNEGLIEPQQNVSFLTSQVLQQLKNPSATNPGALLLFLKQYFKILTRRKPFLIKAYNNNLKRIWAVFRSRAEQKLPLAYLK